MHDRQYAHEYSRFGDSAFSVFVSSSRLTLSNSTLSRDEVEARCDVSNGEFGCRVSPFVSSSICFLSPFVSGGGRSGTSSVVGGLEGDRCLVSDLVLSIPSIVGVGTSTSAVSSASSKLSYQNMID
jgi:hypothetical protein